MDLKTLLSILSIAAAGFLSAPGFAAELAKVKLVVEKPVIVPAENAVVRPSYLKTIKAKFDTPNAKIGELHRGWGCGRSDDILWSAKTYSLFSMKLSPAFRGELVKAHYPIPVVRDSIFDDAAKAKTDTNLQVGALIKEVAANFCDAGDGFTGGVYMKVFWQLYSPDTQKVLFEATTEGSYQPDAAEKTMDGFYEKAFAVASRNLLAEQGFYNAITGNLPVEKSQEAIKLKGAKASGESLVKNVTTLRSAVVTIVADTGSGSGFFISRDGYVLSNWHVVGGASFVKVKLPTGRDLLGEVVRTDRVRDVALLKTEAIAVQPMAVRRTEPNIGEDVYALGSPLGNAFNTTLTHGILSGYRTLQDKRYLQSDVAILPGDSGGPLMDANGTVVGITVSGLGAKGLAGMNFFIPIGEALSALKVDLN